MTKGAPAIGLDFGTFKSCMAWINPETGIAEALDNDEGEKVTPSAVYYFDEGPPFVGKAAMNMLPNLQTREDQARFIRSVKRNLVDAPPLSLPNGRSVTAGAVAAEIMAKLRRDAGVYFQEQVQFAVITHPASFGEVENDALREAARAAGFVEVELLPEPVAAALAFARQGRSVGQSVPDTILVYDLGAGTFDVAVLAREDDGFQLAVRPDGLERLGGDDFDRELYKHWDADVLRERGRRVSLDPGLQDRFFLDQCRLQKHRLSEPRNERVTWPWIGIPPMLQLSIERNAFEALIQGHVDRTVDLTGSVLSEARGKSLDVRSVLLVGGSSRVPLVKRRLADVLSVEPVRTPFPDQAVALGAAHYAQSLWRNSKIVQPAYGGPPAEAPRSVTQSQPAPPGFEVEAAQSATAETVDPRRTEAPRGSLREARARLGWRPARRISARRPPMSARVAQRSIPRQAPEGNRPPGRPGPVQNLPPFDTYASISIENVWPEIDEGYRPIKRVVGDTLEVQADIFKEGRDLLQARVIWRAFDESDWSEAPMRVLDNDRWLGRFKVDRNTRYVYSVLAFTDVYGSWRDDLQKRLAAAQDVRLELLEGLRLVELAAARCEDPDDRRSLEAYATRWRSLSYREAAELAISAELGDLIDNWPDSADATTYRRELLMIVDRPKARFSSWYQLFPRSQGVDPTRSATLTEAEGRLQAIAAMGFDTVSLTPIHPIGVTKRKGPNNSLVAGPNDPGSPYAIGSASGGHDAIAPELGTMQDFLHFQERARELGLELAMDFAAQVSPDHPWVTQHPEWFHWRPDGTLKSAENPPRNYGDVYPLDFHSPDHQHLWSALRDVIVFWVEHGVRIFRVTSPGLQPFAFWERLIPDVQSVYPDVIFVSGAIASRERARLLGKVGFSQSCLLFTRNLTKSDLTDCLTELTQTEMAEYYRGNLFTNTPDLLPRVLQTGGRPAFRLSLILAATLSSNYGMYSGFELCENAARWPESESYLDSEMYQHKVWDWERPDNIVEDIQSVNQIRRENSALQLHHQLRFHPADNDRILAYSKATPSFENIILCVANLDPTAVQSAFIDVPITDWGIPPDDEYVVHDLLAGVRYTWRGERNGVRLDPQVQPAHIFRIERRSSVMPRPGQVPA